MGVHRCRKCAADSVINMPQHKLALCGEHFLAWVEKSTFDFIHKHRMFEPEDRVLVAVSGGKDSLSLWAILLKLGFHADGLYIDLGIDDGCGYSKRSVDYARKFAQSVSPAAELHVVDVGALYGKTVAELAARRAGGRKKLCSVCGLVKRHEMNRAARELGYPVLATGHNLDDEAAVLFGNTLRWEVEYLVRQAPVLPSGEHGLMKRVKPLARFYERETAAYAIVSNIDYIEEECPFSKGATSIRLKESLNSMEIGSPGTKLNFYFSFLRARKSGIFPGCERPALKACEKCGQATAIPGLCAFCRLTDPEIASGRENDGQEGLPGLENASETDISRL
ncbi:MAG: ATP-binding protein [Syntrophobacteraceae bacterium]|nr:ATP-binding protein [Syntrophobacteraceae bacterium]